MRKSIPDAGCPPPCFLDIGLEGGGQPWVYGEIPGTRYTMWRFSSSSLNGIFAIPESRFSSILRCVFKNLQKFENRLKIVLNVFMTREKLFQKIPKNRSFHENRNIS